MSESMARRPNDRPRHSPNGTIGRMTCFYLFASLFLASSQAQAHDIRADGDPSNDWIEGLENSDKQPCCGNNDCYPLQPGALQFSPDREFTVKIGGNWFFVPERNLLRDRSPDGSAWACPKRKPTAGGYSYRVEGVRCLLLPLGM